MPAPNALVRVSDDRLAAFLDLCDPDACAPSLAEVEAALAAAGVVYGVLAERIAEALALRASSGALSEPVCIAAGSTPQPGRDGTFEFRVAGAPGAAAGADAPAEAAIDFHDMRRFVSVTRGQLLARWCAAREGQPGRGVDGAEIAIAPVHEVPFAAGDNVRVRDDGNGGSVVEAALDGAAVVAAGNKVSVLDLLRIDGDVDFSVGNIETTGSVLVTGSVRGSFQVRALHDIVVQGTVEDAIVEAGGSLTVRQGILGGEFGHVKAGGSVTLHHAQNARIECGGDAVFGDSDIGSTIRCGGVLSAVQKGGRLSGGDYSAVLGVLARELGSMLGVPTRVRVGINAALEAELAEVTRKLSEVEECCACDAARFAEHVAMTRERVGELRMHLKQRVELREALAAVEQQCALFEARFRQESAPAVTVLKAVFSDVTIEVRSGRCEIRDELGQRRFTFDPDSGTLLVE